MRGEVSSSPPISFPSDVARPSIAGDRSKTLAPSTCECEVSEWEISSSVDEVGLTICQIRVIVDICISRTTHGQPLTSAIPLLAEPNLISEST